MTVHTVSSTAQFHAAMKLVRPGDEVRLTSGTYNGLQIQNLTLASTVTVTSADPDHPAVVTGLLVKNSTNLTFRSVEFSVAANAMNTVQVYGSHHVAFDQVEVHGPAGLGAATKASPFMIRNSQSVTVERSEFHDLWHAVSLLDTSRVTIRNNSFHDIRTDGVRGGGNSNLLIEGNLFTDFHPAKGDHPDAIQLWSTNQAVAAHDIVIRGNLVVRGDGEPVQGVFIRDTFDMLPFERVKVENNTILGGAYNGLTIDGVVGGSVTGNTVLGYADQRSWIRLVADHDLRLTGNTATFYLLEDKADPRLAHNALVDPSEGAAQAAVRAWVASHADSAQRWSSDLSHLFGSADAAGDPAPPPPPPPPPSGEVTLADGQSVLRLGSASTGHGNAGDNRIVGTQGGDALHGLGGNDLLQGLDGDDTLFGGAGNDDLRGDAGNDWLFGGEGNDRLVGGAGNDWLNGGDGNDVLESGTGADWMTGGGGADVFAFRTADLPGTRDVITDWQTGVDKLSFRGFDLDPSTAARDKLSWIGEAAFGHVAGQVHWERQGADIHVSGDLDGDGVADFLIVLQQAQAPLAGDVLL